MMIHQKPKITYEMDIRVQNQLNRLLSPEFDVTIAEAGDLINILNVIKAKCASCPEKFRLLVGLLCQVDLSITNIEEHYEQLLIKNRIFHLLRMFPDVAHPLLDLIARATNQCSPLASRPVTIGRLEEKRYPNKTQHTKGGITAPQPIPHNQQRNRTTCLHNAAQHSGVILPKMTTGSQQASISTPRRLLGPTPVATQAFFGQTITPTVYTAQPLVGIRQPPEFDASRKMYDQAPLSFRQSSLQKLGGGLILSGTTESPTDIQKRILLQQQHHLRQQLEILQARRQQQQMVCPQSVTFALPKMVTTNTPGSQMESSVPACSTVIGPLHSLVEPMRMTTRSSRMLVSQQQTQRMCDVKHGNIDIKPLDLRSPERRKATEAAKNTSLSKHPECIPSNSLDYDSHEVPCAIPATENADKERGLLLSQVGQHCIMVSAVREDRSGSESQDSDTNGASKRSESETEMTKTRAKSRPRKRKTSGCKGPIIKVQDLCHMTRSSQKGQVAAPSVGCDAKSALFTRELETANGNPSVNIAHKPEQGDTSSKIALKYQGPYNYNNNNNNNNNNDDRISQDLASTKSKTQRSSKRRKADKPASKSKTKQRMNSKGSGSAGEISVRKPQPMVSEDPKISQDASSAQTTKKKAICTPNVTPAVFEPVTGAWSRALASNQTCPNFRSSQSSDDTDSTYLLYGGCDDDAWYQSPQFDEEDIPSNSVTEMQSFTGPDTFYGRLVEGSFQGDNAWINSTTSAVAYLSGVKRKLSPTKTSQGKREKKK